MRKDFNPKTSGKHKEYQVIPDFLIDEDSSSAETVDARQASRSDRKRFEWLKSHLHLEKPRVTDIGANCGYFSLMSAKEFDATVSSYEFYTAHTETMKALRDRAGLDESRHRVFNEGVALADIKNLEDGDLLILLNVIHHAGEDFDDEYVRKIEDWRGYAVRYLSETAQKFPKMVFQMGYTWLGHAGHFCSDDEIINFTIKLLQDSGWSIDACGVMSGFSVCDKYEDYKLTFSQHNPVVLPAFKPSLLRRIGMKLGLVGRVNMAAYRFAQRPLFICSSK